MVGAQLKLDHGRYYCSRCKRKRYYPNFCPLKTMHEVVRYSLESSDECEHELDNDNDNVIWTITKLKARANVEMILVKAIDWDKIIIISRCVVK